MQVEKSSCQVLAKNRRVEVLIEESERPIGEPNAQQPTDELTRHEGKDSRDEEQGFPVRIV